MLLFNKLLFLFLLFLVFILYIYYLSLIHGVCLISNQCSISILISNQCSISALQVIKLYFWYWSIIYDLLGWRLSVCLDWHQCFSGYNFCHITLWYSFIEMRSNNDMVVSNYRPFVFRWVKLLSASLIDRLSCENMWIRMNSFYFSGSLILEVLTSWELNLRIDEIALSILVPSFRNLSCDSLGIC